jgi:hypothetical protein
VDHIISVESAVASIDSAISPVEPTVSPFIIGFAPNQVVLTKENTSHETRSKPIPLAHLGNDIKPLLSGVGNVSPIQELRLRTDRPSAQLIGLGKQQITSFFDRLPSDAHLPAALPRVTKEEPNGKDYHIKHSEQIGHQFPEEREALRENIAAFRKKRANGLQEGGDDDAWEMIADDDDEDDSDRGVQAGKRKERSPTQKEMDLHRSFLRSHLRGIRTYRQPLLKALQPALKPFAITIQLVSTFEQAVSTNAATLISTTWLALAREDPATFNHAANLQDGLDTIASALTLTSGQKRYLHRMLWGITNIHTNIAVHMDEKDFHTLRLFPGFISDDPEVSSGVDALLAEPSFGAILAGIVRTDPGLLLRPFVLPQFTVRSGYSPKRAFMRQIAESIKGTLADNTLAELKRKVQKRLKPFDAVASSKRSKRVERLVNLVATTLVDSSEDAIDASAVAKAAETSGE